MSQKIIKLQAGDEKTFEVPKDMAEMLKTVKDMLADLGETEDLIPLPNVTGSVLEKVLEYVKYHYDHPAPKAEGEEERVKEMDALALEQNKKPKKNEELKGWDKDYVTALSYDNLFAVMLAANYLDLKPLLDVCAKMVAILIKDKDAEGIRKLFNLKPAFTPEEEAQLREQIEKIE